MHHPASSVRHSVPSGTISSARSHVSPWAASVRAYAHCATRFEAASGDVRLSAIVVDCDETSGRAREIKRVMVS